jgi:tRNA threonylcarbamoyladenosine biosynthesis protein TsaB
LAVADEDLMLAIDTSTEMTGVALFDGSRLSELVWNSGRNQTVSLLEQIRHLLALNRRELSEVGVVSVATGPGTFNGLRVGLSTAKGLAYGLSIPILGVGTLDATAFPHREQNLPIRAFVPAGRGRVVFCDYRRRNQRWVRDGEMQNRTFEDLTAGLADRTLVVGESLTDRRIEAMASEFVDVPHVALRQRRPASVAEIAWRRWGGGERDDIAALEPLYVHGERSGS